VIAVRLEADEDLRLVVASAFVGVGAPAAAPWMEAWVGDQLWVEVTRWASPGTPAEELAFADPADRLLLGPQGGQEAVPPPPCECHCGYSCGRQCGLEIMQCMAEHYEHDCGHVWDGPTERGEESGGCCWESATCSKCGAVQIWHDMACGP
jgi:hypothetical protein